MLYDGHLDRPQVVVDLLEVLPEELLVGLLLRGLGALLRVENPVQDLLVVALQSSDQQHDILEGLDFLALVFAGHVIDLFFDEAAIEVVEEPQLGDLVESVGQRLLVQDLRVDVECVDFLVICDYSRYFLDSLVLIWLHLQEVGLRVLFRLLFVFGSFWFFGLSLPSQSWLEVILNLQEAGRLYLHQIVSILVGFLLIGVTVPFSDELGLPLHLFLEQRVGRVVIQVVEQGFPE